MLSINIVIFFTKFIFIIISIISSTTYCNLPTFGNYYKSHLMCQISSNHSLSKVLSTSASALLCLIATISTNSTNAYCSSISSFSFLLLQKISSTVIISNSILLCCIFTLLYQLFQTLFFFGFLHFLIFWCTFHSPTTKSHTKHYGIKPHNCIFYTISYVIITPYACNSSIARPQDQYLMQPHILLQHHLLLQHYLQSTYTLLDRVILSTIS